MGYETSKFGDAGYTAGTTNVVSNVSNHYGQRGISGERGVVKTEGGYNEYVVSFDNAGGPLYDQGVIPVGAVVTEIMDDYATGAVATATVGGTNIATAAGTPATYVKITTAGTPVVTGPTAGKVIIRYFHIVG